MEEENEEYNIIVFNILSYIIFNIFYPKDLNEKKIGLVITLLDPFIISLTGTIVSIPKWNYVIQLLLGFVVLLGLIYSFYEILGRIIKRKVK